MDNKQELINELEKKCNEQEQMIKSQSVQILDLIEENKARCVDVNELMASRDKKIEELEEYCEGYRETIKAYQRSNEEFRKRYRVLIAIKGLYKKVVGIFRAEKE